MCQQIRKKMKTNLTIQNLKDRKSYIVAKITRLAGVENVKKYMDLMLFLVECGFNGTVYELIIEVNYSLKATSKKSGMNDKIAELQYRNNDGKTYSHLDKNWK